MYQPDVLRESMKARKSGESLKRTSNSRSMGIENTSSRHWMFLCSWPSQNTSGRKSYLCAYFIHLFIMCRINSNHANVFNDKKTLTLNKYCLYNCLLSNRRVILYI